MQPDFAQKKYDKLAESQSCKVDFNFLQNDLPQKEFRLDNIDIQYKNTAEILNSSSEFSTQPHIINLLCLKQERKLVKITKINIAGKTLEIKDQLSIDYQRLLHRNLHRMNVSRQKLQIIKQQIVASIEEKSYKKNNKNIVKNMIRLFKNWLQKKQMLEIKVKVLKLTENQKFNNSLIQKIALDLEINQIFSDFLSNHVIQQINASRIIDKKSHLFAIKCYLRFLKVRPLSAIDYLKINH